MDVLISDLTGSYRGGELRDLTTTSTNSRMLLNFKSDSSDTGRGFILRANAGKSNMALDMNLCPSNSIFRSKQVFNNPAKNIVLTSYTSYSATLLRSIDRNFKWCNTFLSVSGTWNLPKTWFFKWKAFLQKRQW